MGGVNQDFSGRLAESPLTQHFEGRVHCGSSRVFRTSCASGELLLPPLDKDFGMWVSSGAYGCVLLGTGEKPMGSGGNQARRSQPGWSCSLRDGISGFLELFITFPCNSHNQGMKPSRGVPRASIPFAMPGSFPSQNRGTCQVQAAQDMTLF